MAGRTVTIEVPDELYERLSRRAAGAQRSVAAEVVEVLAATPPPDVDAFPERLDADLARLEAFDDDALLKLVRRPVPVRKARRLESLNLKKQQRGLNAAERQVAARLLGEFDRRMLIRAHALLLLKQRGFDVATLVSGA
jgi:hypothetical protein